MSVEEQARCEGCPGTLICIRCACVGTCNVPAAWLGLAGTRTGRLRAVAIGGAPPCSRPRRRQSCRAPGLPAAAPPATAAGRARRAAAPAPASRRPPRCRCHCRRRAPCWPAGGAAPRPQLGRRPCRQRRRRTCQGARNSAGRQAGCSREKYWNAFGDEPASVLARAAQPGSPLAAHLKRAKGTLLPAQRQPCGAARRSAIPCCTARGGRGSGLTCVAVPAGAGLAARRSGSRSGGRPALTVVLLAQALHEAAHGGVQAAHDGKRLQHRQGGGAAGAGYCSVGCVFLLREAGGGDGTLRWRRSKHLSRAPAAVQGCLPLAPSPDVAHPIPACSRNA